MAAINNSSRELNFQKLESKSRAGINSKDFEMVYSAIVYTVAALP